MTTAREHVCNLLNAAEHGYGADNDDLSRLPAEVAGEVRAATNRIVALAASGDQLAARHERLRSIEELIDAMLAGGYDPASKLRLPTNTSSVADFLNQPPTDVRRIVDGLPRT